MDRHGVERAEPRPAHMSSAPGHLLTTLRIQARVLIYLLALDGDEALYARGVGLRRPPARRPLVVHVFDEVRVPVNNEET
jgi:hypothetical protein